MGVARRYRPGEREPRRVPVKNRENTGASVFLVLCNFHGCPAPHGSCDEKRARAAALYVSFHWRETAGERSRHAASGALGAGRNSPYPISPITADDAQAKEQNRLCTGVRWGLPRPSGFRGCSAVERLMRRVRNVRLFRSCASPGVRPSCTGIGVHDGVILGRNPTRERPMTCSTSEVERPESAVGFFLK
jgi:hypothetical protein